jgi:hypothetical protein
VRIRAGCLGNFVSQNSIFSNAGWGIVLGNSGVTVSNLVTLTEVVSDGVTTGIHGSMSTYARGQFLIQFYENPVPDPSGYGEGLTYIGSTNITTGANGQAAFALALPVDVAPGAYLSATATDRANTTWEFGLDEAVAASPSLSISLSGAQTILVTNPVTHVVTTNSLPATVTASWPANPPGFVLQCATNLTPPAAWSAATNTVSTNGTVLSTTAIPIGLASFYRLLFQ